MRVRIAHTAGISDTETVKAVAMFVIEAGCALCVAVVTLDTERCLTVAPGIVLQVTGRALIVDALACIGITTLGVFNTGYTFLAVLPFDTDRQSTVATAVATELASLADPGITGGHQGIIAIAIPKAGDTGHPAGAKWRVASTACVVSHVTKPTGAVDTLACTGVKTVSIIPTAGTEGTVIEAEWFVPWTAGVIGRVAESARFVHTLLTITIVITAAPDTVLTIDGTEGRLTRAPGIVCRVTGYTCFIHALTGRRVSTNRLGTTADTAQSTIIIDTDRRFAVAALIGADDA